MRHASAAEQSKRQVIQDAQCETLNAVPVAGVISVRAFSHTSPMAGSASCMLVPDPCRQWILLDGPVDAVHQHVLSFA